jgi:hypothetical protein
MYFLIQRFENKKIENLKEAGEAKFNNIKANQIISKICFLGLGFQKAHQLK